MSKLIALLQFLLALSGVQPGGASFTDRINVDGIDTLYSKAHVEAGVAQFACVASASGLCHYTLFRKDCLPQAGTDADCLTAPIKQFTVASGDSEQLAGLPEFRLCVRTDAASPTPDCKLPEPIARR